MPAGKDVDMSALPDEIFRLAVEASPCGMIVVKGDGTIAAINDEVERLFGYRREELFGQQIECLLPNASRGIHANHRAKFMRSPSGRHLGTGRDFVGRRKDGGDIQIEVGLSPARVGDDTVVFCAIVDINERKRIEQVQEEFIATVSHELRTPMTSIAGSLGLVIGGAVGTLPQSAVHLIEIAHANCRRLVRLVNEILDAKKLESGQMDFIFQRCEPRPLVEQAIDASRGFAENLGVRIRLDGAVETFDVQVDPDRFAQVITNLLSNALKYSPTGGEVVVTVENCGDNVRIAVRDHGRGIPAEFKSRIFGRFAQADNTNGSQKTGTGLGLSIVQQIVTHMHGQVGFDAAPGGGTIFYVDLPSADHFLRQHAEFATEADLTQPAPALSAAG
jgi:PAS domain S-box-containing protein